MQPENCIENWLQSIKEIKMSFGWSAFGGVVGSIFGGPIGAAIGAGIGAFIGNDDEPNDVPPLKLRATEKKITLDDGEQLEVFEVSFKGTVLAPADKTQAKFILIAKDCTGGKDLKDADPLGTSLDDFSSTKNGLLSPSEDIELPYEATTWEDWVTMFTIPIAVINFPYRGNREIEFALVVENRKEEVLAFATCKINTTVAEIGYMELDEMYLEAEKKAIYIASLLVKYNSGIMTLDSAQVIKNWISDRVAARGEEDKDKTKQELTQELTKSKNSRIEVSSLSVFSNEAKLLDSYLPTAGKYSIMEFLLQFVASFEKISSTDIEALDTIADELKLEDDEYRDAKHKYIRLDDIDSENPFVVLGIPMSMSHSEKKAKLRELFNKWNSLAIHKDKDIRAKAEKMLNCIAECQKHLKQ